MRNLSSFIEELAGPRGYVWVIRAQNAGKSTLINALKKGGLELQSLQKLLFLGLRLGFRESEGFCREAKMYDTPCLLRSYLD